jgi:uncharacterized protein YebE (UPF0316 family)
MIALLIFISRIIGILLGTMRIKYIAEKNKLLASILGFFEMIVFCFSIGYTIKDLTLINILSYSGGMAIGTYLGLLIKEKFD